MTKEFDIDSTMLRQMMSEMAFIYDLPLEEIIKSEVPLVLKSAMARTKVKSVAQIKAYFNSRKEEKGFMTLNEKVYKLSHRYSDILWSQLRAKKDESMKRELSKRGLPKATWYHLAQKIGKPIDAPAYVMQAKGLPEKLVSTTESRLSKGYGITIRNNSGATAHKKAKGIGALHKAVKGRRSYFETSLKKGVFKTSKRRLARYPGITVKDK